MTDEVTQDQSDLKGGFRWANLWSVVFFSLDSIVMIISLVLNMCLVRAVARNRHKETPVYFFLFFIFFTSLVDDALIIEYFMSIFGHQAHTTTVCQFLTFTSIGNRLLQVFTVTAMIYYAWVTLEYKSSRIEQMAKKFFPLIVVGLILLEVFFTLAPTVNVRGSKYAQYCYYVQNDIGTTRRTGWLFMVLFPYFLPLILIIFPFLRIVQKLRQGSTAVQDRLRVQLKIVLTSVGGFFFFHLLYYILMLGREVEVVILDKSEFRKMLGLHIWFITRPMFACIALGWHIITPLAPFVFDEELLDTFPGRLVNKHRKQQRLTQQESLNSIGLQEKKSRRFESIEEEDGDFNGSSGVTVASSSSDHGNGNYDTITTQVHVHKETTWTEVDSPFARCSPKKTGTTVANMIDQREFNQTIS